MATITHVTTPVGPGYDIHIEAGALQRLDEILAERDLTASRIIVGTNTTVAPLYGRDLAQRLPDGVALTIQDGEKYKTLQTVEGIYNGLVQLGADRKSLVVALGGGVVGDTFGFVAASYMRGIRLVQVPTTLLAMVDSSTGGKTGVDLPQGKNLVGAFKQPELVVIDPNVLSTLSPEDWRCGLGEVIKHGLLADPSLLDPDLLQPGRAAEFLQRAIQVKVDIVEQDPYEQGIRAHLNLGHTFAHALEQVSGYTWKHGDAVAVGLVAAARLSTRLELCGPELEAQITDLLTSLGMPTTLGRYNPENIWQTMSTDKKWQAGKARFVLLKEIGKPLIMEDVPAADVLTVLSELSDA